ncbi:MAG: HEAT repeat domain-containing protein [Proteobacteria bacterium]|nr:HEAT repeat domain-containing protein [Pseudomonadota bacterium]
MSRFRSLKLRVQAILGQEDWQDRLGSELAVMNAQELVGPLFSLLLHPHEEIRWHAVTALGATVARMADEEMERARVVMRRFLWHMNEESGNVGWGIPESMGEAMARHPRLAEEYYKKLASYVQCPDCLGDNNYVDHAPLRQATYWGLARLAQVRPGLAVFAAAELLGALTVEDSPVSQGLACWALGLMGSTAARPALLALAERDDPLELYRDGAVEHLTLGALAREALATLEKE